MNGHKEQHDVKKALHTVAVKIGNAFKSAFIFTARFLWSIKRMFRKDQAVKLDKKVNSKYAKIKSTLMGAYCVPEFQTSRKDELKLLTDTLTDTISRIRSLMTEVQGFGSDVITSSKIVKGATDTICSTMQSASSELDQVAETVEIQASDADTCATQMNSISI